VCCIPFKFLHRLSVNFNPLLLSWWYFFLITEKKKNMLCHCVGVPINGKLICLWYAMPGMFTDFSLPCTNRSNPIWMMPCQIVTGSFNPCFLHMKPACHVREIMCFMMVISTFIILNFTISKGMGMKKPK
jgi:hypothetical protein